MVVDFASFCHNTRSHELQNKAGLAAHFGLLALFPEVWSRIKLCQVQRAEPGVNQFEAAVPIKTDEFSFNFLWYFLV